MRLRGSQQNQKLDTGSCSELLPGSNVSTMGQACARSCSLFSKKRSFTSCTELDTCPVSQQSDILSHFLITELMYERHLEQIFFREALNPITIMDYQMATNWTSTKQSQSFYVLSSSNVQKLPGWIQCLFCFQIFLLKAYPPLGEIQWHQEVDLCGVVRIR